MPVDKPKERLYGRAPYRIVLVHGGPGARGELAPVAVELENRMAAGGGPGAGVVEALQGRHTIEGLVEELDCTIKNSRATKAVLVGYSWGAWLSILYATLHRRSIAGLILVSSGPLLPEYAARITETRLERMDSRVRDRVSPLLEKASLSGSELALVGEAMESVDAFCKLPATEDPASSPLTGEEPDGEAFSRIWPEASALRQNGLFLEACRSIACPIAVIHGDYDVHPSAGVIEPLVRAGKKPTVDLLARCGHKPWEERYAREEFFAVLEKRIEETLPPLEERHPLLEP
jgi:pimeloyl-ACP methyl ester carboxylesterase